MNVPNRMRAVIRQHARALAREPLLHFVVLGAAIFGLTHYFDERARLTQITITQDQIRGMAESYRIEYGRAPTPRQIEALINSFIKEEVLYRQARKLGLDADDDIVRRRLVQKYEFLEQDLATPSEATESQLQRYYRKHAERYLQPETVTFAHVYFSPDSRGERGAWQAAHALALTLNQGGVARVTGEGDQFPGGADFGAASREALHRVFGGGGLADAIFDVQLNQWSAPLRSGFGWHTVYVTARRPAKEVPFDDVRDTVRRDYLEAERDRRDALAFEKLRKSFRVVRE